MKYRTLGRTGVVVSVVGVGTWQLGGEWGKEYAQDEADEIIQTARECGINLIDTAECYGDHVSEQFVGRAISADRDKWVLATKFGHKFNGLFDRDRLFDVDNVKRQLEGSLKALKTDYIDIYQFHSGTDEHFETDGLWEYLSELKKNGTVKYLGVSIGANDNIFQTSKATDVGADCVQVVYNRLDQVPEKEVFPSCIHQNLGVLARVPLASGLLSGKYKKGHRWGDNDVRGKWGVDKHDERLEQVEKIAEQEVPSGVPMAQWALAWCLKHDAVTTVIPGCKNAQQVRSNAESADLNMVSGTHPQAAKTPDILP